MEKEAIKLVEALHRRQDRSTVTALSADEPGAVDGIDADESEGAVEADDDGDDRKDKKKK
jgi:hypothetical protein